MYLSDDDALIMSIIDDDHVLIRLKVYLSTMNPENFGWGWEVKN